MERDYSQWSWVFKERNILLSWISSGVTGAGQSEAWQEERDPGNVVSAAPRTMLKVQRKWVHIKTDLCAQQKSVSHRRRRLRVQTVPQRRAEQELLVGNPRWWRRRPQMVSWEMLGHNIGKNPTYLSGQVLPGPTVPHTLGHFLQMSSCLICLKSDPDNSPQQVCE